MTSKGIDCVEMKRRGAERVYELIKDMTVEEEFAFWREETEKLDARIAEAKSRMSGEPIERLIENLPKLDLPERTFDCVEMKHRAQEAIARELEGMTEEEQLEYWRKRTEELRESVEKAREAKDGKAVKR